MKNIIKTISLLVLVCFSFFYTDKVMNIINQKDPLMIKIESLKEEYEVEPVNAMLDQDTIIPGINGRQIDVLKSYEEMKSSGIFREELLVYKDLYPSSLLSNNKDKYIILEIIPTKVKDGDIAQLSALKLNGLKLEDRFDYRLDKKKIKVPDILRMTDYDNDYFKYVATTKNLLKNFKKFSSNLPLLIIDNSYTRNYLEGLENDVYSIFEYLDLDFSDDVFDRLINKYNLEPSNYLVDLLYEALIRK